MQSLEYVCAATGERIGFEGPLYGETLTGLRARVWDYSLASRGMTGITRKAREATVTVKIHDSPATLDLLRRLADADMASANPGTLVADGEWEAKAWITKSEPQSITPTMVETQLTIVLADGVWRRPTMTHFTPRYDSGTADLDYPYDYPHDFAGMALGAEIVNDTSIPQPVKLTIFGPCAQPYVIIGNNRYEVDTGLVTNCFAQAVRGSGKDSGRYVFQPLAPGTQPISWPGGFQFDLTVCEERSEPPWT